MNRWLVDTAERALWTGVQSFLAAFAVTDLSTARTAGIAAAGAILAVIKCAAAARIPNTVSPGSTARG
jgi:hypothetical protein